MIFSPNPLRLQDISNTATVLTDLENPQEATRHSLAVLVDRIDGSELTVHLLTCDDGFAHLQKLIRSKFPLRWSIFEILPIVESETAA